MKKLLLLTFLAGLIVSSCGNSEPQCPAFIVKEALCDSALATVHSGNTKFYQIVNPNTNETKRVKLSEDSIKGVLEVVRKAHDNDSLLEAYLQDGNSIEYIIGTYNFDRAMKIEIDNKKITKIYYMPGFDEMKLSDYDSGFFDFLSKFENDREYRMAHLAKPVNGFDYPSQYDDNGELRRASSHSWQKENIEKYLDIYSDVNERARLGLGEQFWRISPTYACLIVTDSSYMWGGVYGFKKTDGEWLLTDFSASTAEYPSMGSVMSGVPVEAMLIMQKAW